MSTQEDVRSYIKKIREENAEFNPPEDLCDKIRLYVAQLPQLEVICNTITSAFIGLCSMEMEDSLDEMLTEATDHFQFSMDARMTIHELEYTAKVMED